MAMPDQEVPVRVGLSASNIFAPDYDPQFAFIRSFSRAWKVN